MKNYLDARNATYDELAKRVLSRKVILAYILKGTIPEFADCSLCDIERKYIEGEPYLAINTVALDDTLDIKGRVTESKSPTEGQVTFDIMFDAIVPLNGNLIKIIINIEAQKTTKNLNYPLMKRAVYYVSRLISSQKEKEFHGDNYNGLKKVYSIWICMNVQKYREDSIQEYSLSEKVVHGIFQDAPENYDLMKIIVLNVGKKETTHRLLNLLHLLFMDLKTSAEKEKILKNEYEIEMVADMREELEKMGGLMEPLLEIAAEQAAEKAAKKAAAESEKKSRVEDIRSLMATLNMTVEQAMAALRIPADKQNEYRALI